MVDAEGGAGGDGARRKMDALEESALEIVPLELYDSARAKIAANLQWICAKAYGIEGVPDSYLHSIFLASVEICFCVWIWIYLSILGYCCWVPLVFK
uniref:CASAMP N-terminal domain-containing protein n=1 Tax=Anas platyrhynchos platyrhynchos TaxID=8840 RepID=A0A493T8E5_ANAPP